MPDPNDTDHDDNAGTSRGKIGPYYLIEEIGTGGMGSVWLAEQREPIARRVALKLIKLGMDSNSILARFDSERQALALMAHPNIAGVLDAGADEDGRPYIVMEFVPGEPVTAYCDRRKLCLDERIALFQEICRGVQHAHQRGIIHRDLKPRNILVQERDGAPVPKIIDFGVAKATAGKLTDRTLHTEFGQLVGTPEYMSPEQAEPTGIAVDTRSDVYSLGVLLYELLTGALPLESKELRSAGPHAIHRFIRDHEPVKPSTRVGSQAAQAKDHAGLRRLDSTTLCRRLRDDLDWITMKALEKDPRRRYQSASEFAADLDRHRQHEPVLAAPPSGAYRIKRLVRKHLVPVLVGSSILLALLAGLSLAVWQWRVARASAHKAARKAEETKTNLALAKTKEKEARDNLILAEAKEREAKENLILAKAKAKEAKDNLDLANIRLSDFRRMSDVQRLNDLVAMSEELWPATESMAAQMRDWIQRANDIVRRLPKHESKLAELRKDALPLPSGSESRRSYRFTDAEKQWQHDVIASLVTGLHELRGRQNGSIAEMQERLGSAESLRARSIDGAAAKLAWEKARAAIRASSRYAGLDLEPQLGLLPIGPDPDSGLWEFAHLLSGKPAVRDPLTHKLRLSEDSGIVLVLLPGAKFLMGAQAKDRSAPNHDEHAGGREADEAGNPVLVELDGFFLSKYEMTQGQWLRVTSENPSMFPLKTVVPTARGRFPITLLHPVGGTSWLQCERVLRHLGLVLPTEAQWEYGARAGVTNSPWWCGDKKNLDKVANLADAFFYSRWRRKAVRYEADLNDGFLIHAPIGSFRANAFGLHDVIGNMWEWCQDGFGTYDGAARPSDGLRTPRPPKGRVYRGGGCYSTAVAAASTRRGNAEPDFTRPNLGCRPARAITP